MKHIIEVENIKCRGCANTIEHKLNKIDDVTGVQVDVENGRVTIEAGEDSHTALADTLLQSGYPEKGTAAGIKAAKARAKSFVSCAIGKMS